MHFFVLTHTFCSCRPSVCTVHDDSMDISLSRAMYTVMESDAYKETNWFLPLVNLVCRQLRLVSYAADAALGEAPGAILIGFGDDVTVLKGMGDPVDLAHRFGLPAASGRQGVAHTRMATESAVTAAGSHPFAVGPDQCLVHNGSFSNHLSVKRELEAEGVAFDSENDTEVGARFVAKQLAEGVDLEKALRLLGERFDGFYTLLVSTRDSFAVVRDPIACKPAIIAEHTGYVAMASEYRALAGLPGIESARIFEPEPEEVYVWHR